MPVPGGTCQANPKQGLAFSKGIIEKTTQRKRSSNGPIPLGLQASSFGNNPKILRDFGIIVLG